MCKITATQIAADGAAVGTAMKNIAALIVDAAVAGKLTAAADALIKVTGNWTTGSAVADLEDAENAAIAVLNLIPVTTPYAPFVAIAFAALNLLLANSQTQTTQTSNAIANAHRLLKHEETINTDSPWFHKAEIEHHFMHSPQQDFVAAWNKAEEANTGLGIKRL